MSVRSTALAALIPALALLACGSSEETAQAPAARQEAPAEAPAPEPSEPADLPVGLVLALAQFETVAGKPVPGAARLEFLHRSGGKWKMTALEDDASNVFHKAMAYETDEGMRLLTAGGTEAILKLWRLEGSALQGETIWEKDFGGKFSRMRDVEVGDIYGDGEASIAVATHDQGVVAVLRPGPDGFSVAELDSKPDTFVHEIEIGDLDADGKLEIYATPSEPNRLDGGAVQTGEVVRYEPGSGEGRTVVARLPERHAKEILVADVDGDGTDELYVSFEGHVGEAKELVHPVEIRRYDAGTPPDGGTPLATIDDRLSRFLTVGDVDGDGRPELVAATYSAGLYLLRPGATPEADWSVELIDKKSGGFEHASILADLDGDGRDELYVASDKHKEVRRYVWPEGASEPERSVIYERPDDRAIFTWNLMPVPRALIPGA